MEHIGNHRRGHDDGDHHGDLAKAEPHDEWEQGRFDEGPNLPQGKGERIHEPHARVSDPGGLSACRSDRARESQVDEPAVEFLEFRWVLGLVLDESLEFLASLGRGPSFFFVQVLAAEQFVERSDKLPDRDSFLRSQSILQGALEVFVELLVHGALGPGPSPCGGLG